jgi:hypothetical protein
MPRSWAERERLAYIEGRVEEAALLAVLDDGADDYDRVRKAVRKEAYKEGYDAGYNTAVAELQEP